MVGMRSTFSGGPSRKFLKRTKVYYFVPREPRSVKNGGSPPLVNIGSLIYEEPQDVFLGGGTELFTR